MVIWATAMSESEIKEFCQYQMDSMIDDGGKDFYVFHISVDGRKSFYDFCKENGIVKRSFEERMGLE